MILAYCFSLTNLSSPSWSAEIPRDMATKIAGIPEIIKIFAFLLKNRLYVQRFTTNNEKICILMCASNVQFCCDFFQKYLNRGTKPLALLRQQYVTARYCKKIVLSDWASSLLSNYFQCIAHYPYPTTCHDTRTFCG